MRKSSLGRRSSTQIPVRVPSLGGSSAQKTCSGGKKRTGSLLKQPGFSQTQGRQRRSQSEDRESHGGRPLPLVRSSTAGNLPGRGMSSMTPITPRQSLHHNLPTSSIRPPRNQTMSSDANRRMSSFGGAKSNRKDSRPITEKAFQQAAQQKVQKYFNECDHVLSSGVSIRPMNTQLFVDMMDHLLKSFDSRTVITKSNYLEKLPDLLKKLGYRSKVDRSWLMTVNTPHSWPHVIAVLSWLVDAEECMNCVDALTILYPENIEPNENEESEDDIQLNSELAHQLKSTYKIHVDQNKTMEDKCEIIYEMDSEFIGKQIIEQKCTNEDLEMMERGVQLVKEEAENETQRKESQLEHIESLVAKHNALLSDCQSAEEFVDQSSQFISGTDVKLATIEEDINYSKSIIAKKQEELTKLQDKINCQTISLEDKEKLTKETQDLHRMIQFYESSIRELANTAFTVEIKFAEEQRKLDSTLVEYNKLVAENSVVEPRLKDVEVDLALLKRSGEALEVASANLKSLKEEYRASVQSLHSSQEESESVIWKIKQDMKETEEKIAKETSLLEGLECDIKSQEDLINKETQKLKDEQNLLEKMIKEIMDEISHLKLPSNLEDKKLEVIKLEQNYEFLQKRGQTLIEAEMEITAKMKAKLEVEQKQFLKRSEEFIRKYL